MTEKNVLKRARWRRQLATTRARVEIMALFLTLILFGAVAFAVVPAVANDDKLVGEPVPEDLVPAIVAAALSCPSLNPPRLAAQIMAASGFSEGGPHGNIAAMDPASWAEWRPTSSARVTDRAAVVTAVARRTCQLVGQVRAGGLDGDLWPAAVAAEEVGAAAVVQAKGVPKAQQQRVDRVSGYASWYADRDELATKPRGGVGAAAETTAVPVSDDWCRRFSRRGRSAPASRRCESPRSYVPCRTSTSTSVQQTVQWASPSSLPSYGRRIASARTLRRGIRSMRSCRWVRPCAGCPRN